MTSITQRFAVLREAARAGSSKLDPATLEIGLAICADIIGVDVIDVRAPGDGRIVIDVGSGHTIEILPPGDDSGPEVA